MAKLLVLVGEDVVDLKEPQHVATLAAQSIYLILRQRENERHQNEIYHNELRYREQLARIDLHVKLRHQFLTSQRMMYLPLPYKGLFE